MSVDEVDQPPAGGLPTTAMQEQFSVAFVHMIASAAGCSLKRHDTDYDGVDLTIRSSAEYEVYTGAEFDIQLKCTTQQELLRKDHLVWTMKAKPFKHLINPKRYNPAYLGVLLVPSDPQAWIEQDEGYLITRSRMFWQEAAKLGSIPEGGVTKDVHLPRGNLFDVAQLLGIMKAIGEGGSS
ncbi:DUF4365 domain-containing protein [Actinoallomurus iriomotensis]|uniref:DUF4365 domain-containing protein n=1 Tax=Actinoallomurus iriomotensis TaxID=478107 RepID=A0A9W6RQH6_9ACTN|nr:DUF4365 domain-containing protein [Actinoallomurus iriomotensis]GLY79739.1 hypothetical protein Airi01_080060 [Actinoallomurus iriomotensis]